jgi:hypothetical protein
MSKVEINSDRYTVDPLFQWDKNQTLYIYGVRVDDPEIHFSNEATVRSIAVIPTVDKDGVIAADIPNSFLQKSGPLKVYICGYERSTFKTYFKIQVPVKARPRPADYTLDANDGEVYSFNELNKRISDLETALNITEAQSYYGYTYDSHSAKLTETLGKFSLKKYFPIISNSLKAIRSAFENFKAIVTERFSELNKKTDDNFSFLTESMSELAEEVEIAKTYREPWRVDGNLGYISPSVSTFCRVDKPVVEHETNAIYMKNSGQIYISLSFYKNSGLPLKTGEIRLNGVPIKSYTDSIFVNNSYTDKILLTVNKGDKLTIYLKRAEVDNPMGEICCDVHGLIANVETPYTYLHLTEGAAEVTAADILNVLTGGAE